MTYLRIALRNNQCIHSLVEHFKKITKILNTSIFSFMILNLVKKGILDFHVTTAADICINDLMESCLRRAIWRNIMEALKTLTIITL